MNQLPLCAYPTDWIEQQSLESIAKALKRKGFELAVDRTMSKPSEVGLFLGHQEANRSGLAQCPVIMLHDLGQAHNRWPNFWDKESWGTYEWGIIPNEIWAAMARNYPRSDRLPRKGLVNLGWPKSDDVLRQLVKRPIPDDQHISGRLTVLYAPSWEFDGQQDKFLRSVADLPINVLIKQQYYEGHGHNQRVAEMAQLHRGRWKNVYLLEPITKIFEVLRIADCIVSDESSTMVEGAMVGCVPIAVMDWKIPDTTPPRPPSVPFDFVHKLQTAELRGFLQRMTNGSFLAERRQELRSHTSHMPHYPGCAADEFANFLIRCLENQRASNSLSLQTVLV